MYFLKDKNSRLLYKPVLVLFGCSLFLSLSGKAHSAISTYTDEAAYKAALSSYAQVSESFEDTAWDTVRTALFDLNVLPGITNQGLTWQSRFSQNGGVTTSDGGGYVHQGFWLFYAQPHGGYNSGLDCTIPGDCGDGFIVSSGTGLLYGIGGWFTGTGGPEIKISLDGNLINGAGVKADNIWQFFGVINTNGFTSAEIHDSSGTEGDPNYIFADDFTFGVSGGTPTPVPITSAIMYLLF